MSWWKRDKQSIEPPDDADRHVRTEGLWIKCEGCGQIIWRKTLEEGQQVCPKCGYPLPHRRADAPQVAVRRRRVRRVRRDMVSTDPLEFRRFEAATSERLDGMREATGCPMPSFPPAGC